MNSLFRNNEIRRTKSKWLTALFRIIKNALCRLISPLHTSGNKRVSSADIRSCVRRLCAAASSKPYKNKTDEKVTQIYAASKLPSGIVPSTRRARNS
ncbi:unnamed protein product [Rotaria socialis]|uniref:Uncharacterized protein n=1 Tax=Rotaria socialis TaxID=392032 RepID=A0A818GYP5_9BILA|nr:unnamed protein product [Rotaria socialis]